MDLSKKYIDEYNADLQAEVQFPPKVQKSLTNYIQIWVIVYEDGKENDSCIKVEKLVESEMKSQNITEYSIITSVITTSLNNKSIWK